MKLKSDTTLKRAKGVKIHLDSLHQIEVIVNDSHLLLSNCALAILEIFAEPLSPREALPKLKAKGAQDWMELTYTVNALYKIGALRDQSEIEFSPDKDQNSFGSVPIHIAMLNDKTRTESFIEAIEEVIKKGDIALEIGTGTGILAIAAAQAGAAKVYTIEVGAMADAAREIIENSGFADQITILRGWSTQIELPEKADVLIGEIIGNDPFAERVLQNFKDARRRLLKPNARILPGKMRVFGLPIELPPTILKNKVLNDGNLKDWSNWYGIDFSPLRNLESDFSQPFLTLNTKSAKKLKIAGEPLFLTEVDFHNFQDLQIKTSVSAEVEQKFNGILIYFELELGSGTLTIDPRFSENSNSWTLPIWYLKDSEKKQPGDSFTIEFSYGENGQNSQIRFI